tara:strand:+ start:294 stop:1064 length:771 start_codon:yes stop_codon:yes gene_type:complete
MDKTGKIKIKAEYLRVGDFNEGLCFASKEIIKKDYKWIFIDTLGNKAFDIKDNFPETGFNEGFALISSLEEHWFVNKNGINEFGKTWKDGQGEFENGIAFVSDKQYSDFYPINLNGERIDDKSYSRIEIFNLRKDKKIDTKNTSAFKSDQFVPFQKNELWGFKDLQNNVVIEPNFYKVGKFENGICAVLVDKPEFIFVNDNLMNAIIDEKGNFLNHIEMHCFMGFQGELIEFYGGPHFGGGVYYLDKNGQEVRPTE